MFVFSWSCNECACHEYDLVTLEMLLECIEV